MLGLPLERADLGTLLRRSRERTSAQHDRLFEHVMLRLDERKDAPGAFLGQPVAIGYRPPWPVVYLLSPAVMDRYARVSSLLLAVQRTAWHVDTLWLPQLRSSRGALWPQRAAIATFLAGWLGYLQVRTRRNSPGCVMGRWRLNVPSSPPGMWLLRPARRD